MLRLRQRLLGFILWLVYRILARTWRLETIEDPQLTHDLLRNRPVVFAHWHGDEIPLVSLIPRYRIATLVSQSKDGEIINMIIRLQGGNSTRGSSTRGGAVGLLGLVRTVRENGYNVSLAVDGPKGPRHEVKTGVFEMSRVVKGRIYPTGVFCTRAWHFPKSWNQAYLPKPFARIVVVWGAPMDPPRDVKDPLLKVALEEALRRSRVAADENGMLT